MHVLNILFETTGDVVKAARRSASASAWASASLGAGVGIGIMFGSMIQSVARQPELRGELQGIMWLGFALTEAVVFYGLIGGFLGFVLVSTADARSNAAALTKIIPGLMIWTLIFS